MKKLNFYSTERQNCFSSGEYFKIMFYIFISLFIIIFQNYAFASEPDTVSAQIIRYREVFNISSQLSDKLWNHKIPFENVPVLAYDLKTKEEYLINYPQSPPEKYKTTPYKINNLPVYFTSGDLTFNSYGGRACSMIGKLPVVTMGYGLETPLENLIQTFIHEGFHHYQFSSLYDSGIGGVTSDIRKHTPEGPRTMEYDIDLIVEARLLHELTCETSGSKPDVELLKCLAATEKKRKEKLTPDFNRLENYLFLTEGSAVYVELKALKLLLDDKSITSVVSEGTCHNYSYFKEQSFRQAYESNLKHFGTTMLKNKINLPSTANGEITYRYALAFVRLLEKLGANDKKSWSENIFPLVDSTDSPELSLQRFKTHIDSSNLSTRLLKIVNLADKDVEKYYQLAVNKYISTDEIKLISDKITLESNMDKYPDYDGWRYHIQTGRFTMTYFDWLTGSCCCDKFMQNYIFFSGLYKLEAPDKSLVIEKITIPVVSNMFKGEISFKDKKHSLKDAQIKYTNLRNEGNCDEIYLKIDGLELCAKNALVIHNEKNKETTIRLMH